MQEAAISFPIRHMKGMRPLTSHTIARSTDAGREGASEVIVRRSVVAERRGHTQRKANLMTDHRFFCIDV